MNHYSPQGTYLLSHRKRRIAKKHAHDYRKEYNHIPQKGYNVYLHYFYEDGFCVYTCKPYMQNASVKFSVANYLRNS